MKISKTWYKLSTKIPELVEVEEIGGHFHVSYWTWGHSPPIGSRIKLTKKGIMRIKTSAKINVKEEPMCMCIPALTTVAVTVSDRNAGFGMPGSARKSAYTYSGIRNSRYNCRLSKNSCTIKYLSTNGRLTQIDFVTRNIPWTFWGFCPGCFFYEKNIEF